MQERRDQLRLSCRSLHGHGAITPAQVLADVARWCEQTDARFESYGRGALIEDFEARVAELLGFPAARFFPSGTMAQPIALRIWSDRAGLAHVAMHPTSHLELHEERGYAHLHDLRVTLAGPADAPLLAEHFAALSEKVSALLVELPIREAGGQLPTWEQLLALGAAVREANCRLHLDGARLWECAAFYGRTYAEICEPFDSAYVSFYKGIGALPGSMLLGSRDFVDEAIVWQRRCGGNLYTFAPSVASAAMQLDERIARMPDYYERAQQIALVLGNVDGVAVMPEPPQTNMMHIFLAADAERALRVRDQFARDSGVWLFGNARPADVPGHCRLELYVGDGALGIDDEIVARGFAACVA